MNNTILSQIVISVASGSVGFVAGYLVRAITANKNASTEQTFSRMVLVVVLVVWAYSVIVDVASPTYETSPLLYALMGSIVGFYYRPWQKGGKNNG